MTTDLDPFNPATGGQDTAPVDSGRAGSGESQGRGASLMVQAESTLRQVWRRRWVAVLISALICVAGWSGVMLMPDKYEVVAKLQIDTASMLRPLLKGLAVDTDMQQHAVRMIQQTLLVRTNLEKVARATDMDLNAKDAVELDGILEKLRKTVRLKVTKQQNIFVLSYVNEDPELAKQVVDEFLAIFVEESLGMARRDTDSAGAFIAEQIDEYEAKLTAAEDRLKEFKRLNASVMPETGGTYFQRLERLSIQISESRLQLLEAVGRRDALKAELGSVSRSLEVPTYGGGAGVPAAPENPLDVRIRKMEEQLDTLRLSFTEQHPDVINAAAALEQLLAQRDAEQANADEVPVAPSEPVQEAPATVDNPIYQELKIALGTAESEVAALKARIDEFLRREVELKESVETLPVVEAQLARLNRDYNVIHEQYIELVRRREAATLSQEADQRSDKLQLKVIEPPRVPLQPDAPNRPLLSSVVLVGSLGIGVMAAFGLSLLSPVFSSKHDLSRLRGVTVLGTVSRHWTRAEKRRRALQSLAVAGSYASLLACYGMLVALQMKQMDIFDIVDRARELI